MNCIRGPFCFLLVFFIVSGLYAEEEVNSKEVKIRYKMPSIVMTAHVDWPKDLNNWDTMDKFVVIN